MARVSERSEFRAAPIREEHRGPMRFHRIGSRPAVLSLGHLSLHEQRKVCSLLRSRSESSASCIDCCFFPGLKTKP